MQWLVLLLLAATPSRGMVINRVFGANGSEVAFASAGGGATPPAAPPILCLGTNTTRLAGLVAHFPLDDRDTLIASEALSGRLSWRV